MKLLILTTSYPGDNESEIGGTFVYNEALAYSLGGAKVTVLTPHFGKNLKQKRINPNFEVKRFQYFWPKKLQLLINSRTPIYRNFNLISILNIPFLFIFFCLHTLKESRSVDIIHCQWTSTVLFALPSKYLFKKKIIVTARGSDIRLIPRWINKWLFNRVDAAVDCYGPQPWNEKNIAEFPINYIKLPLIINDESLETPKPISMKGDLNILYLGRIDPIKIYENKLPLFELVDVVDFLNKEGNNVTFTIIGGGDKLIEDKLFKHVKSKSSCRIQYVGPKSQPYRFFRGVDLGVGGIGFNTVCQEFAYFKISQLLVDSPDNHGTPWKHLENCIFVKPSDKKDLYGKISSIIENKHVLSGISEGAYDIIADMVKSPDKGGGVFVNTLNNFFNIEANI